MKKVLMLGTGGTIASGMTQSGLIPVLSTQELVEKVPEISDLCEVTCRQLFSIDSTNITPAHWLTIAEAIRESYDAFDGFVIAHGTDTMAYTAAALSYLIQGSPKPIILTGAQKPILFENTDSKTNLTDAFRCAVSDLCGVMIVFNGRVILPRAQDAHDQPAGLFQHQLSPARRTAKRLSDGIYPSRLLRPPGLL